MPFLPLILAAALSCTAIDGDTLRCGPAGKEHVRLLGIDAPEMPGHCRAGRDCAPGDPFASKASLQQLVQGKLVRLQRYKKDLYGRTLAIATAGGINLSCAQLKAGMAIYKPNWDWAGRISRCQQFSLKSTR